MNADRIRQSGVTLSFLLCIIGSAIGSGAAGGTPITEAAGGALSSDATLLAPAGPAFGIWSIIYAGLGAYTVFQWLPSQKSSHRQRRLGWWVAASMLLNAAWILSIQADLLVWSVPVIAVLLAVLAVLFLRYTSLKSSSRIDAVITDGKLGLYLGWVCVAVCANITAALVAAGFTGFGLPAGFWAVAVLAVVAVVGSLLALHGNGRLAVAAAIAWGLAWIVVGRTAGAPESTTAAVAAGAAAAVVVLTTAAVRVRRLSRPAVTHQSATP
ncbi:tryptophan-rich sensory protein [Arthrobacter sp. JZ12]|uniref:tryptophan-rich sensory protein n=1 Tax=Arthrobacter sp. JZ12 TaxID=2654190 RepID=UPI002B48BA9F|nr:tryptophan-rich sensory protein [Arthrobacter sp. JZ12]WRH23950.1 tryptophan-rich sensory protein [Arthrobacter sp. JZ12]